MPDLRSNRWTVAQIRRLIDERPAYTPRYELVEGELLVTPSPNGRHQRIVGELYVLVRKYIDGAKLGETRLSPAAVTLTSESYVEPDLFVIPAVDGHRPPALAPVRRLLLAVEVLSPASTRHDRLTKRRLYQQAGVPDYWIVDGARERFEIWHPADDTPTVADRAFTWAPEGAPEPLTVDVAALFAAVRD